MPDAPRIDDILTRIHDAHEGGYGKAHTGCIKPIRGRRWFVRLINSDHGNAQTILSKLALQLLDVEVGNEFELLEMLLMPRLTCGDHNIEDLSFCFKCGSLARPKHPLRL